MRGARMSWIDGFYRSKEVNWGDFEDNECDSLYHRQGREVKAIDYFFSLIFCLVEGTLDIDEDTRGRNL